MDVKSGTSQLVKEIKGIRKDLTYIKEHMIDVDSILTPEEHKLLRKSMNEFKQGKTVSLERLKKELGL